MVKMELGASSAQANSVSSMSASRVAGYQAAMTSLSSFSASDRLSGNAYDNAKAYATGILVPLMQGGILLSQGIAKAAAKLPADYVSEVAPESLDSDVLEEQIAHQKALLASAEAQFKSASKLKDPIAKQETQLRAGQSMARLNAKINELEEKLEKLLAFDGASAKIFSELADLKQAVDQGLAMVTSDFKGASSIPTIKGHSLPWVKTINASVAKFSDDGEEAAKLLDNQILKEEMKEYNEKIGVTNNKAVTREIVRDAKKSLIEGEIDQETFNSIIAVSSDYGENFISELLASNLEAGITATTIALLERSPYTASALQYILKHVGIKASIYGMLASYTISPKVNNAYGKVVSAVLPKVASAIDRVGNFGNVAGNLVTNAKFLKALPYGIGSAIDFSSQLLSGEDPGDAAVKTALHLGVAVGAAILLPETLLVTAGVVATNMVIDYVWDNKDDIGRKISKGISKASEKVGDAISSFGKGVLSAFS